RRRAARRARRAPRVHRRRSGRAHRHELRAAAAPVVRRVPARHRVAVPAPRRRRSDAPRGSGGMTTELGLDVRPIAGNIGAEIHGVDLREPFEPAVLAEVRAALLEWKVIFFRDQPITPEQQIAFGSQFGDVTPAHPTLPPEMPEYPEILVLDNKTIAKGRGPSIESRWHTDVTFVPNP